MSSSAPASAASASIQPDRQRAMRDTRQGMDLFTQGDVAGSLELFNSALERDASMAPYLWQRGLTLYYLKEYEEGAKQFRRDVAVNPNDTEEAIWAFLCEAQLVGPEKARQDFLKVGRDSRPFMRAAYELFRTGKGMEETGHLSGMWLSAIRLCNGIHPRPRPETRT
eukprot:jgi/Mesvir1/20940/Mv08011-RA.1